MSGLINMIGEKYGKITVISRFGVKIKNNQWIALYNCKCDCGKDKVIIGSSLRSGNTKSCGCTNWVAKDYGESSFNRILRYYKRHAKMKNVEYNLDANKCKYILKENCFYCNAVPSNICKDKKSFGEFVYNGIDRIDSNLGYTMDNIVPCCKRCNVAKNDMAFVEFIDWIKSVNEHIGSKILLKVV